MTPRKSILQDLEQDSAKSIKLKDLSAKKCLELSDSKHFDEDLSSICLQSETSFFSKGPLEEGHFQNQHDDDLDLEMIEDSEEKQGLIHESDDDDVSSFKRRHKKNRKKKRFENNYFANNGNIDQVKVNVVRKGRNKKVVVVSGPKQNNKVSESKVTWEMTSQTHQQKSDESVVSKQLSAFDINLDDSRSQFTENLDDCLESQPKKFLLMNKNVFGVFFYYFLSLMSFGVISVIDYNFNWKLYHLLVWKIVKTVANTDCVLIKGENGKEEFLELTKEDIWMGPTQGTSSRAVVFKNGSKYYFNEKVKGFRDIREIIHRIKVKDLMETNKRGLKQGSVKEIRKTFGRNVLSFPSELSLTQNIFQLFNVILLAYSILLFIFEHKVYGMIIFSCFIVSITRAILRERAKRFMLKKKFEIKEKVMVLRRSQEGINIKNIINSQDLVPLDVVEVSNQSRVPADMLLIHGRCLVSSDKEKNKHLRSAIPSGRTCDLDSLEDNHFLRAGEKVDFTINNVNEGVFAMVIGTGMGTVQGFELRKLIAKIREKNRYLGQVQTFIKRNSLFLFLIISLVLLIEIFVFRRKRYIQFGKGIYDNKLRVFEIMLVMLKPVVLLLMKYVDDLGILRLQKSQVCLNELNTFSNQLQNIKTILLEDANVAKSKPSIGGFILTKPNTNDRFCLFKKPIKNLQKHFANSKVNESEQTGKLNKFMTALGCCNNSANINNILHGLGEDSSLIEASGFGITFKECSGEKLARVFSFQDQENQITSNYVEVRVFENDENNSLFSVLIEDESTNELQLLTKGSPANIKSVCNGETIPLNFDDTILKYTNKGYRILALCGKPLNEGFDKETSKNVYRSQVETDMVFLGLVLFKKKINNKSAEVISNLRNEGVNVKMLSSQNIQDCLNTAIHSKLFGSQTPKRKDAIDMDDHKKSKKSSIRLVLGTTITRNNVEKLVFNEYIFKNQTNLEIKENSLIDFSSTEFIQQEEIELCLTGRAFQILVAQNQQAFIRSMVSKTKIFAELNLNQREAIINSSVGVNGPFEKSLYVQAEKEDQRGFNFSSNENQRENIFNRIEQDSIEEEFSRNADLVVTTSLFKDSTQRLTVNCSLERNLSGLLELVIQGKNLAALNKQLADFVLFVVWTQLTGLFFLYHKGVSMSKSEFLLLDLLFVFGICTLFALSIRYKRKDIIRKRSLLLSSQDQIKMANAALEEKRKIKLIIACLLSVFVLYLSVNTLWKQSFYRSPYQMDKIDKVDANFDMYYDPFVIFSTICCLNFFYFLASILTSLQYRIVSKSKVLIYSLILTFTLLYFQLVAVAQKSEKNPGLIASIFKIPNLGLFALLQLLIILVCFLFTYLLSIFIFSYVINKNLKKLIQQKETKILELHIEVSHTTEDIKAINESQLSLSIGHNEFMKKVRKVDVQKLEKEAREAQAKIETLQSGKEFRFIQRSNLDVSISSV